MLEARLADGASHAHGLGDFGFGPGKLGLLGSLFLKRNVALGDDQLGRTSRPVAHQLDQRRADVAAAQHPYPHRLGHGLTRYR